MLDRERSSEGNSLRVLWISRILDHVSANVNGFTLNYVCFLWFCTIQVRIEM